MQLHGGYGYMTRVPHRARPSWTAAIQTIYGGTTEIQKEIIGRSLGLWPLSPRAVNAGATMTQT